MPSAACDQIRNLLRQTSMEVDEALRARLSRTQAVSTRLQEAMEYSLFAGGKRLRPALVLWSAEACGGERSAAMPAALAVECIHTFSLIHDDLPAIDNDDVRRGKPTNHRQFGEALAILAGDALLSLAFEILSHDIRDSETSQNMIRELSSATGSGGLIGGEVTDIEGEQLPVDMALVERIHSTKSARLIEASCVLGALSAGADERIRRGLATYGHWLGMAFQATDDLLDATGDADRMGKTLRKDEKARKQTCVRAVGMASSRQMAAAAVATAVTSCSILGDRGDRLAALAESVLSRES